MTDLSQLKIPRNIGCEHKGGWRSVLRRLQISFSSPIEKDPSYRGDIDGLRALAVLLVVGFHAFPSLLPAGFVGVDIFFVISGFLITRIILEKLEQGHFSLTDFYFRRILRIFPALTLVLAACMGIGWAILFGDEFSQLAHHGAGGAAFAANLVALFEVGYFDNAAETKPLLHLWSLGVEEQYYILWPFSLILVWGMRQRVAIIGTLILTSFGLNIALVASYPETTFYLPFTRFWELLIGSILAAATVNGSATRPFGPHGADGVSTVGFSLIVAAVFLVNRTQNFPGWWALLPTVGAAMIIAAGPRAWLNRILLANRPAIWTGLISYPLYLWHWPLLTFTRVVEGRIPHFSFRLVAVALSLILAWATYVFLEKRIRFGRGSSKRRVAGLFAVMIVLFATGMAGGSKLLAPRLDLPQAEKLVAAASDWHYPPAYSHPVKFKGATVHRIPGRQEHEVLFVGDSNMEQFAARIAEVAAQNPGETKTAAFLTMGGCRPIPNVTKEKSTACLRLTELALDYVKSHPVQKIVIGGRWQPGLFSDSLFYVDGLERHRLSTPEGHDKAIIALRVFLETLQELGVEVYLVQNIPSGAGLGRPKLASARLSVKSIEESLSAAIPDSIPRDEVVKDRERAAIASLAASTGSRIIDPVPFLCGSAECQLTMGDSGFIYKDTAHLTASFVTRHATFLDHLILY